MLAQLTAVHDEIQTSIQRLEALTQADDPDRSELAIVRWRVTRASRARWRLLEEVVYPELERRSLGQHAGLKALRAADTALVARSSKHVAEWDTDRILQNWNDYRGVAAGVVAAMRERQAQEKAVLYPLLSDTDGA